MARQKFTLDDAALALVQLEPRDTAGMRQLRDRLRALARSTSLPELARAGVVRAADALTTGARRAADGAAGIAAAGVHLEAAMRELERAEECAGDDGDGARGMRRRSDEAPPTPTHGAGAEGASARYAHLELGESMLQALLAFEMEDAVQEADAATQGRVLVVPPDADPELLDGFVMESAEYLRSAEAALLRLEAHPGDEESINAVFRCFHTLKGTSAFLGLEAVEALAHRAESLMSRVREREIRLEGDYADLALHSIDALDALIRGLQTLLNGGTPGEPAGYATLLAALESAAQGEPVTAPGVKDVAASPEVVSEVAPEAVMDHARDSAAPAHIDESWVRVRTDRLDSLVDMIGELVIASSMIAQDPVVAGGGHDVLARNVAHSGKIVRELQDLSISMRMVPLRALFRKMARVVRDAAQKSGKQVHLITVGEDTEIDRNMVDVIGDPLVHMLRNAVDHGIETPEGREAAGKPERGQVRLSAFHAGGSLVVELSDDGRGLDRGRIVQKATAKGLIESDRFLADRDVFELLFAPGFSTAEQVTELSGRGVGMDVVRRNVESLRGRIDIDSRAGYGSTFSIRLPLTLAMTDGMLIGVGGERYIIPTMSIRMSFRPEPSMLVSVVGRGEAVVLRGEVLPIVRLHRVLHVGGAEQDPTKALLVIIGSGERTCALLIDELLGQQQLVVKSLGDGLGKVPGVSGGAILGDGRVGLILDVAELISASRQGGIAGGERSAA